MIEIKVKTLDSNNHSFNVEEDITVSQFKAHIAETVAIPADTQRIIYCGRVLNDSSKLKDHDLNGKVVHLVQKAPPSVGRNSAGSSTGNATSQRRSRSISPIQPSHRRHGMYFGSMALPTNIVENMVPPPPTPTLADSRLNVARRLLRRLETSIEDMRAERDGQDPQMLSRFGRDNASPEACSTPVETDISADDNTVKESSPAACDEQQPSTSGGSVLQSTSNGSNANTAAASGSSSGAEPSDPTVETSTTTGAATTPPQPQQQRTTEMLANVEQLLRLQTRFTPILDEYLSFMRTDPVVPEMDVASSQELLDRTSRIFHLLGHIYHSLSDIIVRAADPTPRALLCRPILVQSNIVQAGVPIQVEAQINFARSTGGPPLVVNDQSAQHAPSNVSSATATTAPADNAQSQSGNGITSAAPQAVNAAEPAGGGPPPVHFRIPFATRHSGDVNARSRRNSGSESLLRGATAVSMEIPIPISISSGVANFDGADGMNPEFIVSMLRNVAQIYQPAGAGTATTSTSSTSGTTSSGNNNNQSSTSTPQAATATRLVSNQELPLSFSASFENLDDSLVSMLNRLGQVVEPDSTTGANSSGSRTPTTNGSNGASNGNAGQNSQARGNTTTNPTTSTRTRSTARPQHLNIVDHSVASLSGFDPFLRCSSHHLRGRGRPLRATVDGENPSGGQDASNDTADNAQNVNVQIPGVGGMGANNNVLYNIIQDVVTNIQAAIIPFAQQAPAPPPANNNQAQNNNANPPQQNQQRPLGRGQARNATTNSVRNATAANSTSNNAPRTAPNPPTNGAVPRVNNQPSTLGILQGLMQNMMPQIMNAAPNLAGVNIVNINIPHSANAIPVNVSITPAANVAVPAPAATNSTTSQAAAAATAAAASNITVEPVQDMRFVHLDDAMDISVESDGQMEPEEILAGAVPADEERSWENQVPSDWVPIIARDVQRQRRQSPQAALSDVYLSGLPSKRRKIVADSKAQGSLPQVIEESVRRAVHATGLTGVNPNVERIAQEVGDDAQVQVAYRDLLRSTVHGVIHNNEDFTTERYPNASNYFKQ